jgi:class 3 adenylate cyclase
MHLVRLIDVVNPTDTTTINVWYYWVLYTVNELVPSTLLVMPVVWFQQMVIDEERSSSLANLKVQKLQRRQDDLLRALLPPAIIKHLRDGHDALLNSTHEAAVIFVYVTQVKTFSLTSDAPSVIKWLSSVYTAFDDVLQQEFRKSIIKIETQHDHFLAVSGIFDPREDASDVCIRAAARMARAISAVTQPDGQPTRIKIGVSAGRLSGGVVGLEVPRFSVFGQPVVSAARMAMSAEVSSTGSCKIHLSKKAKENLTAAFFEQDCPEIGVMLQKRGEGMNIKGLGFQETWTVCDDHSTPRQRRKSSHNTGGVGVRFAMDDTGPHG